MATEDNPDTSLRPRPGETAQETVDRVVAAVKKQDEEPTPVTKTRRWKTVAYFEVDETPDPAYDVQAHERLADALYKDVEDALKIIPLARKVYVEDVMVDGD
jgi:ribosomal protein S10